MSIATRLLLWFLAISLIPCIVLTLVNNYLSVRSLERSLRSQLLSISSAQDDPARQLHPGAQGRRLGRSARSPRTVQSTEELIARAGQGHRSPTRSVHSGTKLFRQTAINYLEAYGYANLYLFDTGRPAAVPRQVRPQPGRQPADRPAQGHRAGRGLRAVPGCCSRPRCRTTRSIRA